MKKLLVTSGIAALCATTAMAETIGAIQAMKAVGIPMDDVVVGGANVAPKPSA